MTVAEMIGQKNDIGLIELFREQLKNELNTMYKMIKENYSNIPNESLDYIKEAKLNHIDELMSEYCFVEEYLDPTEEDKQLHSFFNHCKEEVCRMIDGFMR